MKMLLPGLGRCPDLRGSTVHRFFKIESPGCFATCWQHLPSIPSAHSVHMKNLMKHGDTFELHKLSQISMAALWQFKGGCYLAWTLAPPHQVLQFLCKWDSRARASYYIIKDWPLRHTLETGKKFIIDLW